MTRLRSAAQRAPQTREQAAELAARYAEVDGALAGAAEERQASIAAIEAAADAVMLPMIAELKDLATRLKPWFEGNLDELTGGKRKSIEIGGCVIGHRIGNPTVHFAHGKDDDAVAALLAHADQLDKLAAAGSETAAASAAATRALIRTKLSPDKPAILTTLGRDDAAWLGALGFSSKQAETFFIDRVGAKPANDTALPAAEEPR